MHDGNNEMIATAASLLIKTSPHIELEASMSDVSDVFHSCLLSFTFYCLNVVSDLHSIQVGNRVELLHARESF